LLEKQYISPDVLKRALEEARVENKRLGEVLLENGYASEEMLAKALAASTHKLFVKDIHVFDPKLAEKFDKSSLEENLFTHSWSSIMVALLRKRSFQTQSYTCAS